MSIMSVELEKLNFEPLKERYSEEVIHETQRLTEHIVNHGGMFTVPKIGVETFADYLLHQQKEMGNIPIHEVTERLLPSIEEGKIPLGTISYSDRDIKQLFKGKEFNQEMLTKDVMDVIRPTFNQEIYMSTASFRTINKHLTLTRNASPKEFLTGEKDLREFTKLHAVSMLALSNLSEQTTDKFFKEFNDKAHYNFTLLTRRENEAIAKEIEEKKEYYKQLEEKIAKREESRQSDTKRKINVNVRNDSNQDRGLER